MPHLSRNRAEMLYPAALPMRDRHGPGSLRQRSWCWTCLTQHFAIQMFELIWISGWTHLLFPNEFTKCSDRNRKKEAVREKDVFLKSSHNIYIYSFPLPLSFARILKIFLTKFSYLERKHSAVTESITINLFLTWSIHLLETLKRESIYFLTPKETLSSLFGFFRKKS